jgi:hypothetical protein
MPFNFQFAFLGAQHNYLARVMRVNVDGVPQIVMRVNVDGIPQIEGLALTEP